MRISSTVISSLAVALISAGITQVQADDYYNPANAASKSGQTTGHELYKTIGCPGRGILDAPCAGAAPAKPAAPKPAAEQPAPMAKPPVDTDGDGVIDDNDRCPGTPAGAKVNAQGCELDGDKDGVVDRLDKCPTTPAGRAVNAEGCELDSDNDGVVDALDKCPTTPDGRAVNAEGCELDSDKDGVVDALDKCPTTPAGNKVDSQGCDLDTDSDGIPDVADQCPDTPAGDRVDNKGCSLPKVLNLEGVNFDNDKDTLRKESVAVLDEAVATLKRYPGLKVEIAGHTDSSGGDAHNLDLSQRRADAVMKYFTSNGIEADRLTAKGYGETLPIADNANNAGRLKNRRVELRSLN